MRRWLALGLAVCACSGGGGKGSGNGLTPEKHTFFPIGPGTAHELPRVASCDSCHPPASESFKDFTCVSCHVHEQSLMDPLHRAEAQYTFGPETCLTCHPMSDAKPVTHTRITSSECALCHDVATPWAALPVQGFTHPPMGTVGCGACHNTATWKGATGAPSPSRDPLEDYAVTGLVPTWSGTTISALTPLPQQLPQEMNHQTAALPTAVRDDCASCHPGAAAGTYYPGTLHLSLTVQPLTCLDCHANTLPDGFVGLTATSPARTPPSGEMRHDAVAWSMGAATAMKLVTQDCALCHSPPTGGAAVTWANGPAGAPRARFHASLPAGMPPGSCLDCHANSRPITDVMLPSLGLTFDHQVPSALGECRECHSDLPALAGAAWDAGRYHLAGSSNPTTCLPCHEGRRPTSTSGWLSTTYAQRPFDYGLTDGGTTHGDGQDCQLCHKGPGTGAWGGTQNWVGGDFVHGPGTPSAQRCVSCHVTQRPPVPVPGPSGPFDHSTNGSGDCFACHQATVVANRYQSLADWDGGIAYPASLVSSTSQFVTVTSLTLNRSPPNNLVTGMTQATVPLYEGMLHTSTVLPPELQGGPAGMPDYAKCWHCHTNNAGAVTEYRNGQYHSALTGFRATPGGAVTPFPQPTGQCNDCHALMLPPGIVQRGTSTLYPMDHRQQFTATVNIAGQNVTGVQQLDCSACHASPGGQWSDGQFHARIGAAVPRDCNGCHYPLLANAGLSDRSSPPQYRMQHRSGQLTTQACDTCHPMALARGDDAPADAGHWSGGQYHPRLASQPGACIDCHAVSTPAMATQSTETYALTQGATATNGGQWMNHASARVAGRDCAGCHLMDARVTGAAWNRSTRFHGTVPAPTTCRECHGLTNGNGTAPGTRNNLPSGLNDSSTVSTASMNATTGIPAGTRDQLSHADVNVTGRDCNGCHTQAGSSTATGVMGREWAQARFHASGVALVMNGTTGRCSNCHLNLKPGPAFTGYDHTALTSALGSTDCSSCHGWPGAGGPLAPNWKGASGGVPATITVGGFTVSQPPASAATTQPGIPNLPHPPLGALACTACHDTAAGGKNAKGYDHGTALVDNKCNACHESGSNLVAVPWNGTVPATMLPASCGEGSGQVRDRQGDTRAIGIANLACRDIAAQRSCGAQNCALNHFFPTDCDECHVKPAAGLSVTKTGAPYVQGWRFDHAENRMQPATCCQCHPGTAPNCKK